MSLHQDLAGNYIEGGCDGNPSQVPMVEDRVRLRHPGVMTPTQVPDGESSGSCTPPPAPLSQQDTIVGLLQTAKRDAVPIRNEFVQIGRGKNTTPGPLAGLVQAQDTRGLQAYLLLRATASSGHDGWDCTYDSDVWIRALDLRATVEDASAPSAVSKAFERLERRRLIRRGRVGRTSSLVVLREDGSGTEYTHPGADREPHFKLPHDYWIQQHYRELTLPGIATLLIALSLPDDFILPYAKAKPWYGIGTDTLERGIHQLIDLGVLAFRVEWVANAKAKTGWQSQRHYTLTGPYSSPRRAPKRATAKTPTGRGGIRRGSLRSLFDVATG